MKTIRWLFPAMLVCGVASQSCGCGEGGGAEDAGTEFPEDTPWLSFFGSDSGDQGHRIAIDEDGFLYILGWAREFDGPEGQSPHSSFYGNEHDSNTVVIKLASNGEYQWHRFMSSSGSGIAYHDGAVYVSYDS